MSYFDIAAELDSISSTLLCIQNSIGDVDNNDIESAISQVRSHIDRLTASLPADNSGSQRAAG